MVTKICDWAKCYNRHSSKNIWVTRLFFCQNGVLLGGSFWQKDSLVTLILFELCLLWYLAQSQILVISLWYIHITTCMYYKIVTKGWSPKFATRLNIIICISSKSIRVTKLSFCQNDPPRSTSFWRKNSLVSQIFFDLCLFQHFSLSQIFFITL